MTAREVQKTPFFKVLEKEYYLDSILLAEPKKIIFTHIIASKLTNVSNVLKFTKAMLWYYCFENKTDDSQPIRSLSLPGGKTI